MNHFDCVIIGAGAAGLMCAATAGQRGRKVALLDHANKVGKKILMSGGGRCNFTNYDIAPNNYLSANPHFCKSALSRFTQWDFIALVEKHGLAYHEKTLGQLFCDNKARDLLNILLAECEAGDVDIRTHCEILEIKKHSDGGFILTTGLGLYQCDSLVIATGGLSIPTMGATGFGYDIAKQFGLKVTARNASLVPFTFKGDWLTLAQQLAGVAADATVECNGQVFREALLFTHKGISGPAALQISNYWNPGDTVTVNWLPELDLQQQLHTWRQRAEKSQLTTLLSPWLAKRFITQWLEHHGLPHLLSKPLADWSNGDIDNLSHVLCAWPMQPTGTEGYRTAEVTKGGIDTDGVSSKTFAAKTEPNLYFIGEVLDVTGWLGGYNFQWAWASGYCAGQYV
ncbi:NAD(P)/FAD-dependent oxidoreductase [Gilvimarinus sp. DA14]|uniref:NAD(P)/FAD-dependent oxidoreductase n=1 Tax=Gilvimarinus sp. DA14 TaxID=2956798 RepID=UPI0020B83D5D|nr:NAD(P)/FAD-dependent oxidoreductase [Gilvimarinus sp. DA14]UTF58775.1 NAD(P)/FAD-dependent oxidoreductase [Gilvimarinus sp. DA14]